MSDLDALVVRWWPMVRGIARNWELPGMAVEDVEQEGLLALLEAERNYDPERGVAFATFAWDVIDRRLADVATKARRQKHRPLNEAVVVVEIAGGQERELLDLLADRNPQPDEVAIAREKLRIAITVIRDQMTVAERTAIRGVLNGRMYGEIAEEMMVPNGFRYVDNALSRGRKKLRAAL